MTENHFRVAWNSGAIWRIYLPYKNRHSISQKSFRLPNHFFTPPSTKGDFHVPIRTDACNFASLAGSIIGKEIEGVKGTRFKDCLKLA